MTATGVELTMGVEEEFFLVDRSTRAPVPRGPQVLDAVSELLGPHQAQAEFYACQIEFCTQPTRSGADLREQLVSLRATAARAARDAGCLLVAAGTAVVPPADPIPVTDKPRYQRMARYYGALVDGRLGIVCGCHVHIGTLDRPGALELANRVRPYLPAIQALAANSPFAGGRDSGCASWRSVAFGRWPTAGPAPQLDAAGYEQTADALVRSGILLDRGMIYWFARPSEHVPTLEIRIADVNADLDTTVLVALLIRGLCATVLAESGPRGRPPPEVPAARLWSAHRYAAHYGHRGEGLDPLTGETVPAHTLTSALLRRAGPGLEAAGDLAEVRRLHALLTARGDGAACQRELYRRTGRLEAVVDQLAATTTRRPG
ncbi:glutamate--cysteine ligase [Streptomyces sp. ISL-94]|uniref:carboxylate-amine ligase n=1 Tax=Streptomyces sp. ISL-94 TaxID=2819190 RepID=UPI001BEA6200|nr:glutamate--cysteine ligase [Streptomyces sp. ISL-94]MBT2478913.1 glutamate--cysteine ligase [Streptomyces sp. ISL-94]